MAQNGQISEHMQGFQYQPSDGDSVENGHIAAAEPRELEHSGVPPSNNDYQNILPHSITPILEKVIYGSIASTSSSFTFEAITNITTNAIQTPAAPVGTTSGFPFSSPSAGVAAPPPALGSAPSTAPTSAAPFKISAARLTFASGGTPSFSFGAGSTAPVSAAPFQFSAAPSTAPVSDTFSTSFLPAVSTPENNPSSVSEEATSRRPVIKAKRRANKP